MSDDRLLEVKDLQVSFFTPKGEVRAVRGISYDVRRGEVMGIVGESGSGKSVSAFSVMGLLKSPGKIVGGSILFDSEDVLALTGRELENFRGRKISMIFQNPMSCLNPVLTIGEQMSETLLAHSDTSAREARRRACEMLEQVGISDVARRMKQYPYELSGGMRQRVMIAMALMCSPQLLIADEPTTALDVTIQAQILDLLGNIRAKTGMSIVFITHNFGIVAEICDRVSVMYSGCVMEQGSVDDVFYAPAHPYTRGLLKAIPHIDADENEKLSPIAGTLVNIMDIPSGCAFHPRCPECTEICRREMPGIVTVGEGHTVRCHLAGKQA